MQSPTKLCGNCRWCKLITLAEREVEYLANLELMEEPTPEELLAWIFAAYPRCDSEGGAN